MGAGKASRRSGDDAEHVARRFLESHGLATVGRNYRTRGGEIDLIMRDGEVIVFVEVRFRTSSSFMAPADSIDSRKRSRIIQASRHYLQGRRMMDKALCRFDVVLISGPGREQEIEWIKDAFGA